MTAYEDGDWYLQITDNGELSNWYERCDGKWYRYGFQTDKKTSVTDYSIETCFVINDDLFWDQAIIRGETCLMYLEKKGP